jgi:Spy/CpxP family protein refolding chaperone
MRERFLQVVSVGFMIMYIGSAWAETEDGGHHGMHRGMAHGGPDMERMIEHMSQRLELDKAQELAIRNIVDAAKPEAEALREQARSNREVMHDLDMADADYDIKFQTLAGKNGEIVTQMTLLHGRVMSEINAELSDEQRAKLSEERDEMRERFRHHRRSHDSADDTTT